MGHSTDCHINDARCDTHPMAGCCSCGYSDRALMGIISVDELVAFLDYHGSRALDDEEDRVAVARALIKKFDIRVRR